MFTCQLDDHLALRLPSLTDADELSAVATRNLDRLSDFIIWASPEGTSPEAERAFIGGALARWSRLESLESLLTYDGAIIGAMGLCRIKPAAKWAEIGYWIDADYEGRGYVTSGVRALERIAFVDLGCQRVQIRCAAANARSRAVPTRLGYTLEGILRQGTLSGAGKRQHITDHCIFSILNPEWEAREAATT